MRACALTVPAPDRQLSSSSPAIFCPRTTPGARRPGRCRSGRAGGYATSKASARTASRTSSRSPVVNPWRDFVETALRACVVTQVRPGGPGPHRAVSGQPVPVRRAQHRGDEALRTVQRPPPSARGSGRPPAHGPKDFTATQVVQSDAIETPYQTSTHRRASGSRSSNSQDRHHDPRGGVSMPSVAGRGSQGGRVRLDGLGGLVQCPL